MGKREFLWRLVVQIEALEKQAGRKVEHLRETLQTVERLPASHGLFRLWASLGAGAAGKFGASLPPERLQPF